MRVTVVRPGELGPEEAALWAQFQVAHTATTSPFLSLTYAQTVGRSRPNARVAVIEDGNTIEGFLAFELLNRSVAVPIGSGMNDMQALLGSGFRFDARAIVKKAGLHAWRYDHLLTQTQFSRFHASTRRSPVIDLSRGYDHYLAAVRQNSKDVIAQVGRKRRKLEREIGRVTIEYNSTANAALSAVLAWKSAQYLRTGKPDQLSDHAIRGLVEELAATHHDDCRGIVNILRVDDRPVAGHFGLQGPRELAWYFPAYDTEYAHYSPGIILLAGIAAEAAARGIAKIDLGRGELAYKMRLSNDQYEVAQGAVYASRAELVAKRLYRRLIARNTPVSRATSPDGGEVSATVIPATTARPMRR